MWWPAQHVPPLHGAAHPRLTLGSDISTSAPASKLICGTAWEPRFVRGSDDRTALLRGSHLSKITRAAPSFSRNGLRRAKKQRNRHRTRQRILTQTPRGPLS